MGVNDWYKCIFLLCLRQLVTLIHLYRNQAFKMGVSPDPMRIQCKKKNRSWYINADNALLQCEK